MRCGRRVSRAGVSRVAAGASAWRGASQSACDCASAAWVCTGWSANAARIVVSSVAWPCSLVVCDAAAAELDGLVRRLVSPSGGGGALPTRHHPQNQPQKIRPADTARLKLPSATEEGG